MKWNFGLKIISHIQFRRSFAYYILAVNFVGGEDFGDCDKYWGGKWDYYWDDYAYWSNGM